MQLSDLPGALDLSIIQDQYEDRELRGAYTSDLLSDVMANADDADVLVTIHSPKNTVAVEASRWVSSALPEASLRSPGSCTASSPHRDRSDRFA